MRADFNETPLSHTLKTEVMSYLGSHWRGQELRPLTLLAPLTGDLGTEPCTSQDPCGAGPWGRFYQLPGQDLLSSSDLIPVA